MRLVWWMALLAASGFGQTPQPAAWLDPDRTEPGGTHYRTFHSKLAGGDVSYLIYLPANYETETARRFPVVYWLHGLNGNQRAGAGTFLHEMTAAVRAGKAPDMIAVFVNGMKDSFYNDSPDGKWPIESVIVKELIPHIDATYRTVARRDMRAIEGYSMGGYGAAHLAFKYPELFGIAGINAGALITPRASVQPAVYEKMFGSDDAYVQANDPFVLLRKNADAIRGRTYIRVAVGGDDSLLPRNRALHEALSELHIDHDWEIVPGVAHNPPLFYRTLGERTAVNYQKALGGKGPSASNWPNATGKSRVLQRGDLEILTFETEQDYDKLQEVYKSTENVTPAPGVMTALYYRSAIDGSVQPYAVRLPNNYTNQRKYPLIIQLHGTNFHEVLSGARLTYRGMGGPQWIHPDLQIIYAHCFGGPTTFYQGIGEKDVLAVVEEVKRRFAVDADRVYLMGHSMGGAGSFVVGLHYPDRFGGIGAGDAAPWSRDDTGPEWMKPQTAIVAPANLYRNARNVDMFFKNAGAGIRRKSTELADGVVEEGGFATTEVFPGMPHSFGDKYPYANFVAEVIAHPIKRKPDEVKYYTNTLQYDGAYWVRIDRLARHNADAKVTANYKDGSITVTATNIAALTLKIEESPAPKGQSIPIVVDGREVCREPLPAMVHLSKQSGQWSIGEWKAGAALEKKHGLQGPIGDAFNSRFLAVYGDADRELAIAELDAIRNPPGPLDIHGDFPMKAASKVTAADIASAHLILFGTTKSNAVLARIAPQLPAELLKPGSVFIYPNPESPSHYVVVWSARLLSAEDPGLHAGWTMPLNLLPDYVEVADGRIRSGGHFDNEWRR